MELIDFGEAALDDEKTLPHWRVMTNRQIVFENNCQVWLKTILCALHILLANANNVYAMQQKSRGHAVISKSPKHPKAM